MGNYNISRNLEASLIDYIKSVLTGSWTDVSVEKTFNQISKVALPGIFLRVSDTIHETVEIGGTATKRFPLVLIDLFCKSDGQRLDLKDFLVSKLKSGCPYYQYVITNGVITSKTANGRIRVTSIQDTPINFTTDKSELEVSDRYRHLLTLNISLGKIEA